MTSYAYCSLCGFRRVHDEADRKTWDIAWAAAIAAFSYIREGRIEP